MDFYTLVFDVVVMWGSWQLWLLIDSIGKDPDGNEAETRD